MMKNKVLAEILRQEQYQEQLDRNYKKSCEAASRCSPRYTKDVEEWEADYGDGKETYTQDKETKWYNDTVKPMPMRLYQDVLANERGTYEHSHEMELGVNTLYLSAFAYHALTYGLALWLFIMYIA